MLEACRIPHLTLSLLLLMGACQPVTGEPMTRDGGEPVAASGSDSTDSNGPHAGDRADASSTHTPDTGTDVTGGFDSGAARDAGSDLDASTTSDATIPDAAQISDGGSPLCPLMGGHQIYAGGDYTCAILKKHGSKGSAVCWGRNNGYKLGHGLRPSGPDSLAALNRREQMPIRCVTGPLETLDIVTGSDFTCFTLNGDFKCVGGGYGWVAVPPTQSPNLTFPWGVFRAYGGGSGHYCAVAPSSKPERYTVCRGSNSRKQLGGNTVSYGDYLGGYAHQEYKEVAIGGEHTCALTTWTTNNIECWGDNRTGQVTGAASTEPVGYGYGLTLAGTPEPDAQGVAAGLRHSCALTKQGKVQCWGDNTYGQLGRGDVAVHVGPAEVVGLSDVTAIEAGGFHTCARSMDGGVKCWGRNSVGQLGIGSASDYAALPTAMSVTEPITKISAGSEHTCLIGQSTAMWCTGRGSFGRLGNGASTDTATPTQVVVPCDKGTAP